MKSSVSAHAPRIIFCDNHLLIAFKPAGWLTQPDQYTKHPDLESFAKEWVKREFQKPGAVFLHCIHRLDRPVSGLVLFAKTSKALTRLNELSRKHNILRWYVAEVEGQLTQKSGQLEHYLIHGEHQALISNAKHPDAKQALLTYQVVQISERTTIVRIELQTGRYHQIRAQFSAIGHPIVGDVRYGAKSGDGKTICLSCTELQFPHPVIPRSVDNLEFERHHSDPSSPDRSSPILMQYRSPRDRSNLGHSEPLKFQVLDRSRYTQQELKFHATSIDEFSKIDYQGGKDA